MAEMKLMKGCRVRVSNPRARKLKFGVEGVAVWIGEREAFRQSRWAPTRYETVVGVKVDGAPSDAKPVYVNANILEVIGASPDNDLPELYGTARQVAWAMKLRREAIDAGRFTAEECQHNGMQSAKFWIENRPGAMSAGSQGVAAKSCWNPRPKERAAVVGQVMLKNMEPAADDNEGEAYASGDVEPCDDPHEVALSAAEREAVAGESKAQAAAAEKPFSSPPPDFSDLGF